MVDLPKYGGDSFSETYCVSSLLPELLRAVLADGKNFTEGQKSFATGRAGLSCPRRSIPKWTALEWEQGGGRAEESASVGV